jgi:hypothetical protein
VAGAVAAVLLFLWLPGWRSCIPCCPRSWSGPSSGTGGRRALVAADRILLRLPEPAPSGATGGAGPPPRTHAVHPRSWPTGSGAGLGGETPR